MKVYGEKIYPTALHSEIQCAGLRIKHIKHIKHNYREAVGRKREKDRKKELLKLYRNRNYLILSFIECCRNNRLF